MKPGSQRLLEILVKEFMKETEKMELCTCVQCLGCHLLQFLDGTLELSRQ